MTIHDQIRCVSRELRMRQNCYPKWVSQGRMEQVTADWEIDAMKHVLKTLNELADKDQLKLFEETA